MTGDAAQLRALAQAMHYAIGQNCIQREDSPGCTPAEHEPEARWLLDVLHNQGQQLIPRQRAERHLAALKNLRAYFRDALADPRWLELDEVMQAGRVAEDALAADGNSDD